MRLSIKERIVVSRYLRIAKKNPLVEMVYLTPEPKGIGVVTVSNSYDSRGFFDNKERHGVIKDLSKKISSFNIKNKGRMHFYTDDISSYYRYTPPTDEEYTPNLEGEMVSLGDATVLFEPYKPKKRVRARMY